MTQLIRTQSHQASADDNTVEIYDVRNGVVESFWSGDQSLAWIF